MKKLFARFLSVLITSLFVSSSFLSFSVHAETENISISGMSIKDRSATITADEPIITGNTISGSITFNKLNDYVTYELSLKNVGTHGFKISSISDNNKAEHLAFDYSYYDNYIATGETTTATIKISYIKQLLNQDLSIEDLKITIGYENENGDTSEIIFVPNTGFYSKQNGELAVGNIVASLVFLALVGVGLFLIIIKKKTFGVKAGIVAFVLAALLIPFAAFAEEKFELAIVFPKLEIMGKYTDFRISYNLNGGTLPEGQTNPEGYSTEDEDLVLINPSRIGYTFIGWTGDNGDVPETTVIVPSGSTGDKSYTANFKANTDTPYTVIHAYQDAYYDWHYEEEEPITLYGTTDTTVEVPTSPRYGFKTPDTQAVHIKPDGSAEVVYNYDREKFSFSVADHTYLDTSCMNFKRCTEDGSYPFETAIILRAKQRTGYHIIWSDGLTDYDREFPLIKDTALSYEYQPNHYTVRYNKGADDATGEMADQEFTYDEEQTLHSNEFVYEGHTFRGWGHGKEGSWWHIAPENWTTKNLTDEDGAVYNFYASWSTNKYAVKYYDKEADTIIWQPNEVEYGSLPPTPDFTPEKNLYKFVGWYTDDTYTTPYDFENMTITGPTTIYAKFSYLCGGFENDSWDKIVNDISENPSIYPVGCTKEIEMDLDDNSEPETYALRLVNNSTPSVCEKDGYSKTACGPVLEFVNTISSQKINTTSTSDGGWKETTLVSWLNNEFYNKLPNNLKSVIIPTSPIVSGSNSNGVSDNIEHTDYQKTKIFIPSAREVGLSLRDDNKQDTDNDTRPLDYYNSGGSNINRRRRVKTNLAGEAQYWWLRTAPSNYDWTFYYVEPDGGYWVGGSASTYAVLPMFRIGKVPEYTVNFNTDGAAEIPAQTVKYGETIVKPEDPVREHYDFKGWYTDSSFEHAFDFNTGLTSSQTIYAKFDLITFNVSFNTDGGTLIDDEVIAHGSTVSRPAENPEKNHYSFGGWFTTSSYDTAFDFETTKIYSDTTIYAKFIPDSYTVSFNTAGGSNIDSQSITYPGKATKPATDPIKESHRFDGWFTDSNFETEFNFEDTTITQDTVIYAKYTLITHTVSFNTDGGSNIDSQVIAHNTYATRPTTNPTKDSLAFYDWFANEDRTIRFNFENTRITGDTVIYAKYKTSFSTDDWKTIKDNLVLDPTFYAVGSEKEIELDMDDNGTNESYTVRLVNTSTPEACKGSNYSQTACGIVIEFVDLVEKKQMDDIKTNLLGWKDTELIKWVNADFYNKLPEDLKSVIIPTYPNISSGGKNIYGGNGAYHSTIRKEDYDINAIYLPSAKEVGLDLGDSDRAKDNTRLYDYYETHSANADRIKKDLNGSSQAWWLTTANGDIAREFYAVSNSGESVSSVTTTEYWVAPVFRIGNVPEYTITFNTNGGTEIASQKVKYGEKVTRPTQNPEKAGGIFVNWYTNTTYGEPYNFDTIILENKTIYAYYDEDEFSLDSWATIKANVTSNPNYYPVGSRRQIEMDMDNDGTPESYTVRLANTTTTDICRTSATESQSGCGIVIEFVTAPTTFHMNEDNSLVGGWKESALVEYLNGEFYNKLPEDLKTIIIPTYPIVSGGVYQEASDNITADDTNKNKIYALSAREVGINTGEDAAFDDTRTLDYYVGTSEGDSKHIKRDKSGAALQWWLRTINYEWGGFYYINAGGYLLSNFSADSYLGVAPAFRI